MGSTSRSLMKWTQRIKKIHIIEHIKIKHNSRKRKQKKTIKTMTKNRSMGSSSKDMDLDYGYRSLKIWIFNEQDQVVKTQKMWRCDLGLPAVFIFATKQVSVSFRNLQLKIWERVGRSRSRLRSWSFSSAAESEDIWLYWSKGNPVCISDEHVLTKALIFSSISSSSTSSLPSILKINPNKG